jgi:hypothetical protein
MALEVLSILAMSTEPERVFSGAKITISDRRGCLGDNIIEAFVESKRERMKKLNCLSIQEKENTRLIQRKDHTRRSRVSQPSLKPTTSAGARPPPQHGGRRGPWGLQATGPVRTGTVQSSPGPVQEIFGPGSDQSPIFLGPGLNWPGLLWTSPLGPNRPEYAGSY